MNDQSTEVTVRMADLSPEYSEIMVLGKVLQMSGYFKDVRDQAQAVTKILFGRELGFSPIVSMSGIYIIEGKPALSANLLAAMIRRSGKYDYRVTVWDAEKCEIMFRQKNGDAWEDLGPSSFTKQDAERAGVWGKNTWAKYPKAMLFARALSQGERAYCPDVSSCALYVPEELGAAVNESGEVISTQDLPKSARPVERTTEDIPLKRKEAVCEQAGESPAIPSSATPAETSSRSAAETVHAATSVEPPRSVDPPAAAPASVEYIDQGRKVAFARAFKTALSKDNQRLEERLRHEWLVANKFVDADGVGTSAMIPMKDFERIKAEAVKFAKGLSGEAPEDENVI